MKIQKQAAVCYTPSNFFDHVLFAIGKLSNYQSYIGVEVSAVQDLVLRWSNLDLDQPPSPLDPKSARTWFRRLLTAAWWRQTPKYARIKGLDPLGSFCTNPVDSNLWALTESGVLRARDLRPRYENVPVNATAEYLEKNFQVLYGKASSHLRRKMPRSAYFGKIDDHITDWMERAIRRDSLKDRVSDGKRIPPSHICGWIRKGAYSQIRNEGREPVCRIFHGALTTAEIPNFDPSNWTSTVVPRSVNESEEIGAHVSSGDEAVNPILEMADPMDMEEAIGGAMAFEVLVDKLSEIIRQEITENPDWHEAIMVDRFVKGMTVREIAESRGLPFEESKQSITSAVHRVQAVMKRAREDGEFEEFQF